MHFGPPTFSGRAFDMKVERCLTPTVLGLPFMWQIHGSDDIFAPIFTDEQKLREFMNAPSLRKQRIKDIGTPGFKIIKIDPANYIPAIRSGGGRVMLDPVVVDDDHTRWQEAICEDGILKYLDGTYARRAHD